MNQILEFGTGNNNYKAPKGNKGSSGGPSSDKVVRVFAIILIVVAIALIFSGVYSLTKNKKTAESNQKAPVQTAKATITAEKDEENNKVIIDVSSQIAINKIIYNWNTKTEKEIAGNDDLAITEEIDLPSGTNTLNVKVIDKQNNTTTESFTFTSNNGVDLTKPNITLEITEAKKLLITATDDTELAYITYMWNEGEQTTVEADEDDPKKIEVELDIPRGKNSITVIAVDASENSNTNSATKALDGVTKPEISYGLSADGSTLDFVCTHENGIVKVEYTLNDRPYATEPYDENNLPKEVKFSQQLDVGYNRIILKVTSVDGTTNEFDGQCDYNPNPSDTQPETNQ